ncbi:PREDICTED: uncharacterized protein LOC101362741 [Odobenus rosmarus divergens]|uniref:Uncharacterized protein LOC101362741 n=1 Tax=Odobenus rosmarus divergens TaxID=9708 RepID=A0A9B0GNT0_ODORO
MEKWPRASLAIFWLQLSWVSSEDKVIQSPPSLIAHEGDNSTLSCSYKVTNFQSLFWFKQEEKTPTFLLRLISGGTEKSGRLKGTLDKKELLSTLHITTTQLGDSATYLCAVEAQCLLVSCSPYPNAPAEAPATDAVAPRESIIQSQPEIFTQEGEFVALNCKYFATSDFHLLEEAIEQDDHWLTFKLDPSDQTVLAPFLIFEMYILRTTPTLAATSRLQP